MKLVPIPYSPRMGSRIKVLDDDGVQIAILEVKVLRQGLLSVQDTAEGVVAEVVARRFNGELDV